MDCAHLTDYTFLGNQCSSDQYFFLTFTAKCIEGILLLICRSQTGKFIATYLENCCKSGNIAVRSYRKYC